MDTLHYTVAALPTDVVDHVEKSLESVPHVQSVRFDADSSCVIVEHDGANAQEVIAALREEGIEVQN